MSLSEHVSQSVNDELSQYLKNDCKIRDDFDCRLQDSLS